MNEELNDIKEELTDLRHITARLTQENRFLYAETERINERIVNLALTVTRKKKRWWHRWIGSRK